MPRAVPHGVIRHDRQLALLIEVLAAGTRPPEWTKAGYLEYSKRLPRDWQLQVREIPVAHRGKNEPVAKLKQEDGKRMLALLKPEARVIALDSGGSTGALRIWQATFSSGCARPPTCNCWWVVPMA